MNKPAAFFFGRIFLKKNAAGLFEICDMDVFLRRNSAIAENLVFQVEKSAHIPLTIRQVEIGLLKFCSKLLIKTSEISHRT